MKRSEELSLKLRRLANLYPKEFEEIIGRFEKMAATYDANDENEFLHTTADRIDWVLPPVEFMRGKPQKVGDFQLSVLLADYQSAQEGDQRGSRNFWKGPPVGIDSATDMKA